MFSIYPKVFFFILLSLTLYNIYLNNIITTQNRCGRYYFDLVSRRKIISVTNHTSSKTTLKDRYNILADLVPLNIGYKLSSRLQFNSQQIKTLSFFNSNSKSDSNQFEFNSSLMYYIKHIDME